MINNRILRFVMLFFACLMPLLLVDWFDYQLVALAFGLALSAFWVGAHFGIVTSFYLVYCGIFLALIPFPISGVEILIGVISGYSVLSLIWLLTQLLYRDIQLVISEAGRVILTGISLLLALPLVIALITAWGLEPNWEIPIRLAWPDLSGVFFFIVLPFGFGLPAGMWLSRITRGRFLILGSLAFLAFYPLVGKLPFFAEHWLALLAACAANALLGNALANRFSPRIIAAARLAGARWLDLIIRIYFPLVKRSLTLFLALIVIYAFEFVPVDPTEDFIWAHFVRLIILGALLLYFIGQSFRFFRVRDLKAKQRME